MAYPFERDYYERGPSLWVPVMIFGVVLLVATTPFRAASAANATMAYQPSFGPSGFSPSLIWIPIIVFLVAQFFRGGSYRPRYRNERFPYSRLGMARGEYYPGVAFDNYNHYDDPYSGAIISSFTDYGGHWILILIGIWLFSSIGFGPFGGSRFGFPWSLFSPRPQIVLPMV